MKQEVTKRLLVKKTTIGTGNQQCSVTATLKLFVTKWKPCILCYLAEKPMRYNDLFRIIPAISRKMLSEHLKELEAAPLITRIQYDSKLQKVEYSLSVKGKSLIPVLQQLQNWGVKHINNVLSIQVMLTITMN